MRMICMEFPGHGVDSGAFQGGMNRKGTCLHRLSNSRPSIERAADKVQVC